MIEYTPSSIQLIEIVYHVGGCVLIGVMFIAILRMRDSLKERERKIRYLERRLKIRKSGKGTTSAQYRDARDRNHNARMHS